MSYVECLIPTYKILIRPLHSYLMKNLTSTFWYDFTVCQFGRGYTFGPPCTYTRSAV